MHLHLRYNSVILVLEDGRSAVKSVATVAAAVLPHKTIEVHERFIRCKKFAVYRRTFQNIASVQLLEVW
ncbi:hypothetical protein OAL64_00415 [bacterium]|nr:hypothetical protein [bacterium]